MIGLLDIFSNHLVRLLNFFLNYSSNTHLYPYTNQQNKETSAIVTWFPTKKVLIFNSSSNMAAKLAVASLLALIISSLYSPLNPKI